MFKGTSPRVTVICQALLTLLALLFAALPFAYRMRRVGNAPPQLGDDFRSYFRTLGARPE